MKFVFRVDSSVLIGTGHVMRCLTLALALKEQGSEVFFICRQHPGNITQRLELSGFQVFILPYSAVDLSLPGGHLAHSDWLGVAQELDAELCLSIVSEIKPDWLIVDHYAIDYLWHQRLRPFVNHIMAIDDIADRLHDCDVLLDQNYGKQASQYTDKVNKTTELLLGTRFALLRPEFLQWREYSLNRRQTPEIKQLLITMGGIDADNYTGKILQVLTKSKLSSKVYIIVVMGGSAPRLEQVSKQAELMPLNVEVKVDVNNMAELMANSDLAIGAAGSTSWERCCLGLPTITVVLAENQKVIASALAKEGAALWVDSQDIESLPIYLDSINAAQLKRMSSSAATLVDGLGVSRTLERLTNH